MLRNVCRRSCCGRLRQTKTAGNDDRTVVTGPLAPVKPHSSGRWYSDSRSTNKYLAVRHVVFAAPNDTFVNSRVRPRVTVALRLHAIVSRRPVEYRSNDEHVTGRNCVYMARRDFICISLRRITLFTRRRFNACFVWRYFIFFVVSITFCKCLSAEGMGVHTYIKYDVVKTFKWYGFRFSFFFFMFFVTIRHTLGCRFKRLRRVPDTRQKMYRKKKTK